MADTYLIREVSDEDKEILRNMKKLITELDLGQFQHIKDKNIQNAFDFEYTEPYYGGSRDHEIDIGDLADQWLETIKELLEK